MGRGGITEPFQPNAVTATDSAFDPGFPREATFAHIDGTAIAAVTNLYREILPPEGAILDVMSGWVSHLPPEAPVRRVVRIGSERRALAENPFLDEWRVWDVHNRPTLLPFSTDDARAWTYYRAQHPPRPPAAF